MIQLPIDILNEISSQLDVLSLRNLALTGQSVNSVFQPTYQDYLHYINQTVKPKRQEKETMMKECKKTTSQRISFRFNSRNNRYR